MPETIEMEKVSTDSKRRRQSVDDAARDRAEQPDQTRKSDDVIVGGLAHQIDEEDWLI